MLDHNTLSERMARAVVLAGEMRAFDKKKEPALRLFYVAHFLCALEDKDPNTPILLHGSEFIAALSRLTGEAIIEGKCAHKGHLLEFTMDERGATAVRVRRAN